MKIPAIIIGIGSVFSLAVSLFPNINLTPTVTEHAFNYSVTYKLGSETKKPSAVENIADLFDLIGWNVDSHASTDRRFQTVEAAEQATIDYIDRGIPIMIDWVEGAFRVHIYPKLPK